MMKKHYSEYAGKVATVSLLGIAIIAVAIGRMSTYEITDDKQAFLEAWPFWLITIAACLTWVAAMVMWQWSRMNVTDDPELPTLSEGTDTELLDGLQRLTDKSGFRVVCRWSVTGRGWRLHEDGPIAFGSKDNDVREAVADFLNSERTQAYLEEDEE